MNTAAVVAAGAEAAIVRSAGRQGYFDDSFVRHFVKKPQRKSALSNCVAYTGRIALEAVAKAIIDGGPQQPPVAQVLCWGTGFDTFAMRHHSALPSVSFVDVDATDVVAAKVDLMSRAGLGSFPFGDARIPATKDSLHCGRYSLVHEQDHASLEACLDAAARTLVIVPMDKGLPSRAERWVRSLPNAVAVATWRDGGTTPQQGFAALRAAGAKTIFAATLADVALHSIGAADAPRLHKGEPLADVEGWAEACALGGIAVGATSHNLGDLELERLGFREVSLRKREEPPALGDISSAVLEKWPVRFGFSGRGHTATCARFDNDDVVVRIGGLPPASKSGAQGTSNSLVSCHSSANGDVPAGLKGAHFPTLAHHGAARLETSRMLVFGGCEGNSLLATDRAYLLDFDGTDFPRRVSATTTELTPKCGSPPPRSRHAMCHLTGTRVCVFGGFASATQAPLSDCWLGEVDEATGGITWVELPLHGDTPPPLGGAAALWMPDAERVVLCGGLLSPLQSVGDMWSIDTRTGASTRLDAAITPRSSHAMSAFGPDRFLVVGGILPALGSGAEQAPQDDLVAVKLSLREGESVRQCDTAIVGASAAFKCSQHAVCSMSNGAIAIVGGNVDGAPHRASLLRLVGHKVDATDVTAAPAVLLNPRRQLPATVPFSAEAWEECLAHRYPRCLRGAPLGECVARWADPAYLARQQAELPVSVHVARSKRLDFANKNFTFRHVPFQELVKHSFAAGTKEEEMGNGSDKEVWYFRSVARNMRTERADFWRDFGGLAGDFALPAPLEEHIRPRLHQSCFRVNQRGVHLWTHYDVLDNVLCQIVGRKRVVLFPPEQWGNLYVAGSSSRVLDVDAPDVARFPRFLDAHRHAMEVTLHPGDVLHIPALWFHQITSLDASVSINVFYEHLARAAYDPHDLYGNKDVPAAVELRRSIVAGVKKNLANADGTVPEPYRSFALAQAISELEEELRRLQPH